MRKTCAKTTRGSNLEKRATVTVSSCAKKPLPAVASCFDGKTLTVWDARLATAPPLELRITALCPVLLRCYISRVPAPFLRSESLGRQLSPNPMEQSCFMERRHFPLGAPSVGALFTDV